MNKILLINRIDTNNFHEDRKRIFFLIGKMKDEKVEKIIADTLDKIDFLIKKDIIYKYNGVELYMREENISILIKKFIDSGIEIYSVYELYDPMEG